MSVFFCASFDGQVSTAACEPGSFSAREIGILALVFPLPGPMWTRLSSVPNTSIVLTKRIRAILDEATIVIKLRYEITGD